MKPYKTKVELISQLEVDRHLRLEEEHKSFLYEFKYGHVIDAYKDIVASSVLTGKLLRVALFHLSISLKRYLVRVCLHDIFFYLFCETHAEVG